MKGMISKTFLGEIVYKVKSEKNFNQTLEDLKKSIENNGFSVKHIHNLKEAFDEKKLNYEKDFEYQIVQFCNATKAHKALSMSTDVGIMMPKSIIIFQNSKGVFMQFMKMKPIMVKLMFPNIDLAPMSKIVMQTMEKIVNQASK